MITMVDIRKFGKEITIGTMTVTEFVDRIVTNIVSCGLCSKVSAQKSTLKEISNGYWGEELYIAFKHIETLKTLDVLA